VIRLLELLRRLLGRGRSRYLHGAGATPMQVTLKFLGESLDPASISRTLGLAPTGSGRKGDPIAAELPNGRSVSRPSITGYWYLDLPQGTSGDAAVAGMMDSLSCGETVFRDLAREWQGQLIVHEAGAGVSAGDLFSGQTLAALSAAGLDLYVNEDGK